MLELEVLVWEFIAVDGFAARALQSHHCQYAGWKSGDGWLVEVDGRRTLPRVKSPP